MSFGRSKFVDRSPFIRYGTSSLLVAAAALFRFLLAAFVNRPISAPLFLAAIVFSTWLGGLRLGVYTSMLAGVILTYFFIQPAVGILETLYHILRFGLFVVEGSFVAWLIDRLRLSGDEIAGSREELQELAGQQRSVRDDEQKRIAREIHDELGQALTGLKLEIHVLRRQIKVPEIDVNASVVLSGLDSLSKQVDATIGTVRRISTELRPSVLDDFGLVAAIEWQAAEFGRKSGVKCAFRSNAESISIGSDASTAIFRIFQEALTNIARHAKATGVTVTIDHLNDSIHLCVEDNGSGIDVKKLKKLKSLGILGMRERARLIGAEITISQRKQGGTRVELFAPVRENNVSV